MAPIDSWIWPVLLAPIAGSFVGVLVTRAEDPRSIVLGRSCCPECGAQLGAGALVPFLSWLLSRGRCRHCGKPVSLFYPAIELAAVAVALWAATVASGGPLWESTLLGWTLLALAAIDFRYFVLPDYLTLPLIPAGLFVAWLLGPAELADRTIGAVAGLGFVLVLRYLYGLWRGREGIGLGDAKLLCASGAWVSWQGLPGVILLASITGLTFALIEAWRGRSMSLTAQVPFGTFLCLGTWLVWLYGPLTAN